MRAAESLAHSTERLIAAETSRGLTTIYHQPRTEDTAEGFLVHFIPRDPHGHLNAAGTVMVGSYEDLDTALTIAAVSYGTSDAAWQPSSAKSLAQENLAKHAPVIAGRRFIQTDYVAQDEEKERN